MIRKNLYPENPILIVDDEQMALESFRTVMASAMITNTLCLDDGQRVRSMLESKEFELVLLDLSMPGISGVELLDMIMKDFPSIPVVIITGNIDVDTAVDCIKKGAADYITKPVEPGRLVSTVRHVLKVRALERENDNLKNTLLEVREGQENEAFGEIVTENDRMLAIFSYIEAIAKSPQSVLVTGETGAGKELVAKAIYKASQAEGDFVPINVAGLDDTMFSDTLFGHRKGAFTGAETTREGMIVKAANGCLFLDEIGDLTAASQVKLLRLLQENEYYPVGSDVAKRCQARIVVATNKDLKKMCEEGSFRKDLYFRLMGHHIRIPPLRERLDDIEPLLEHFLIQAAGVMGKPKPTIPPELISLLGIYPFPGNVRELKALVMDAVSKHEAGILSMQVFKDYIFANRPDLLDGGDEGSMLYDEPAEPLKFGMALPTLKQVTKLLIEEALSRAKGNQAVAARVLGISRQALNRRLNQNS